MLRKKLATTRNELEGGLAPRARRRGPDDGRHPPERPLTLSRFEGGDDPCDEKRIKIHHGAPVQTLRRPRPDPRVPRIPQTKAPHPQPLLKNRRRRRLERVERRRLGVVRALTGRRQLEYQQKQTLERVPKKGALRRGAVRDALLRVNGFKANFVEKASVADVSDHLGSASLELFQHLGQVRLGRRERTAAAVREDVRRRGLERPSLVRRDDGDLIACAAVGTVVREGGLVSFLGGKEGTLLGQQLGISQRHVALQITNAGVKKRNRLAQCVLVVVGVGGRGFPLVVCATVVLRGSFSGRRRRLPIPRRNFAAPDRSRRPR